MADDVPYTFSEESARRVARATLRVEGEVFPGSPPAASTGRQFDSATFIVASDPSEYDEEIDLLPLGYRGHVIGYRLRDGLDVTKLPVVTPLDDLLQASASNGDLPRGVKEWAQHGWVSDFTDDEFGRPVLINVCRYAAGQYVRGQTLTAQYLPGFLHSRLYRGRHFAYACPTWGHWPDAGQANDGIYDCRPGWCAITDGLTDLIVELDTDLDPDADPEYAECHPASLAIGPSGKQKTLQIVDPEDGETEPSLFLYSDRLDLDSPISSGAFAVTTWDELTFRMQMVNARCP